NAKQLFRNLYYDKKATSDSFYHMALLKIKDGKKDEAVDFLNAALKIEEIATNIVKRSEIEDKLSDLRGSMI
ncbi:MAG TPA: hypothetical protein PLP30_09300, partial [Clostridia bacterium]|nr:hypothetical protein [Clostridia bacterium]